MFLFLFCREVFSPSQSIFRIIFHHLQIRKIKDQPSCYVILCSDITIMILFTETETTFSFFMTLNFCEDHHVTPFGEDQFIRTSTPRHSELPPRRAYGEDHVIQTSTPHHSNFNSTSPSTFYLGLSSMLDTVFVFLQ